MNLTILRHAQTEGSLHDLYYGVADIPALEDALAELRARAADFPTAPRYYTSGLLRTEQTFRAIYGALPHTRLPGLQEMDFGIFEMHSYEELKDDPAFLQWIQDPEHLPCPGGECVPEVVARNMAAIAQVLAGEGDAVCVIHGGVIANLMMQWFGGDRFTYPRKPGTGYTVTFEEGRPVGYAPIPE